MKAFLDSGRTAFPDGRITIDRVVTGGDMVTYHYTFTGTHRGEWFGIPPTGRRISIATISMDRVVDGKIVESVEVSDNLDFLQQLGIIEKDIVPEAQF
jgi:predicted ester cyclase